MKVKRCKVRIKKYLNGVFARYQPEIGKVYDATYKEGGGKENRKTPPVCVIDVRDKHIALKKDEYEIIEIGDVVNV